MKRVQLIDRLGSEPNLPGTIHITSSHVVFRADEGVKEIWVCLFLWRFSNFIDFRLQMHWSVWLKNRH